MGCVWKHINYSGRSEQITPLNKELNIPGQCLRVAGDVHYPLYILTFKLFHQALCTTSGRVQENLVDTAETADFGGFVMQIDYFETGVVDAIYRCIVSRAFDAGSRLFCAYNLSSGPGNRERKVTDATEGVQNHIGGSRVKQFNSQIHHLSVNSKINLREIHRCKLESEPAVFR